MSAYTRQIAQAQRMIAAKGQSVTWRKLLAVQDADKPWRETADDPATNDFPVKMLFLRPGKAAAFASLILGTDIPTSSVRALMGAVSFVPNLQDTVVRDNIPLTIKSIDVLAPSGEPILYDIEFV